MVFLSVIIMSDVISVEVYSEGPSSSPISPDFPPDHFIPPRIIPLEKQSTVQQVMTSKRQVPPSNVGVASETVGSSSPHAVWLRSTVGNHSKGPHSPSRHLSFFPFNMSFFANPYSV